MQSNGGDRSRKAGTRRFLNQNSFSIDREDKAGSQIIGDRGGSCPVADHSVIIRRRSVMYKGIYAALIGAAGIGASVTAFADEPQPSSAYNWVTQPSASDPLVVPFEGPRPSSLGNWAAMNAVPNPATVSSADPAVVGPRASSLGNWPGMSAPVNPAGLSSVNPSFEGSRPGPNH